MVEFRCPICQKPLHSANHLAQCSFCGNKENAELICPSGHYQCETCRLASSEEIIERVCHTTTSTDPVEIANLIMRHPSFNQYGAEHHLVVAPAMLTALDNQGVWDFDRTKLKSVLNRLSDIPVGACGTRGGCGACEAAGCTISVITKASYASQRERSLTLKTTAHALEKIAEIGEARCCKQSVYAAIETAQHTLKTELGLNLPVTKITCAFSARINDCQKERCPYYQG